MAVEQVVQFIEAARKDTSMAAKMMGGKTASDMSVESIVQAAADMGYHFTPAELMSGIEAYMMQHAADLNPQEAEMMKSFGGC